MQLSRSLRFATISLALAAIIFLSALFFFAKPMYSLHAERFQTGQPYQGETHALMYNRFLINIVAPTSLLLGAILTAAANRHLKKRSAKRSKKKSTT